MMKNLQHSRRRLRIDIVLAVTLLYSVCFYFVVNMDTIMGSSFADEVKQDIALLKDKTREAKDRLIEGSQLKKDGNTKQEKSNERSSTPATTSVSSSSDEEQAKETVRRRQSIVRMTRSAWRAYMAAAAGHDEVMPWSNASSDRWGGIGVTPIDAMDTLLLMGLIDEFEEAAALSLKIDLGKSTKELSVFETIIRHLGASLTIFTATNNAAFLQLGTSIMDGLMHAFDTPLGMPMHTTTFNGSPQDAKPWYTGNVLLAECGSNQLEMRYLAHLTRNTMYADVSNRFTEFLLSRLENGWPFNGSMYEKNAPFIRHKGLWGTFINPKSGKFSGAAGFHSLMDSTYEYLLKQWILFGKEDDEMLGLYEDAIEGFLVHLLRYMPNTNYAVIGYQGFGYFPVMDHLVCFTPGMLILGVMHGAHSQPGRKRSWDTEDVVTAAVDLLATCYRLYAESPTGIGPEIVEFEEDGHYTVRDPKYILRPETIESIFYMYRYTHDEKYREWGWKIAQAIQSTCRTPNGAFSSLYHVEHGGETSNKMDKMESFFFAETLKYLYLLFTEDDILPLDRFVLTTEAHPLPVLKSHPWNKRRPSTS